MSNQNDIKIKEIIKLVKQTENTDNEFLEVYKPQLKVMTPDELDLEIKLLKREIAEKEMV